MTTRPVISIIVPVSGAAPCIGDTLRSLVMQEGVALEAIVQASHPDDAALADIRALAERHPAVVRVFLEPDSGFADALARGSAHAGGTVLGCLGAWDALLPGALARVASELGPGRSPQAVMGASVFMLESAHVAVPHPAEYLARFEQLAVWRRGFDAVAAPSLFWTRAVHGRIGALASGAPFEVWYDLACRLAARAAIHRIDQILSASRFDARRASGRRAEHAILESLVAISRRHWGPLVSPLHWRCALSLWNYGRQSHELARHHARRAEQAASEGRAARAMLERLVTRWYSPAMARGRFGR